MKRLIITFFTLFFTSAAVAEPLQFVNAGSEQGAFRQILTDIGETIEHYFVQASNPVVASKHLQKGNSLTIWSSEWPGNKEIDSPKIDQSNIAALMTYETVMCSREFSSFEEMKGKDVKIATWGSKPVATFLEQLGQQIDVNFVVVPYDGSGSTTRGYLGNDASTVFTITSRETALIEDNKTKCFAYSGKGDLKFRFVDAIITVGTDNSVTQKINSLITELSSTVGWADKYSGSTVYTKDSEEMLIIFNEAVKNFSN